MLMFVIGCLSTIGLLNFIFYGAYGLAVLPASLIQRISNTKEPYQALAGSGGPGKSGSSDDISVHQERIKDLKS
jgi:hypothetical protein